MLSKYHCQLTERFKAGLEYQEKKPVVGDLMTNEDGFKRPLRTLSGHSGVVTRLAWSPDGSLLASPSLDKTVHVWNMTRGSSLTDRLVLTGHRDWVSSVSWAADGQRLASASGDSIVRLWEVANAMSYGMLLGHSRTVFDVDWSPVEDLIATGSGDSSIGIWDAEHRKQINLLRGHSNAVYSVAWSPDGSMLASCSEDRSVRIWERQSWKLLQMYEGHAGAIHHLVWSPDGKLLATASADSTVRIWGRQTGVLEGHTDVITAVSFSSDGGFLISKSLDGSVLLWRTNTWEVVKRVPELSSIYWTAGVAFHPTLPVLATLGDDDRAIRIWRFSPEVYKHADSVLPSVRYTNAKVVVVGDTGVGKTSLVNALLSKPFEATESTHSRDVRLFDDKEQIMEAGVNESRETFIWDMAGQPGYRLIHQLHLNEVAVALIVFDSRNELDPLSGVRHWERALRHAQAMRGRDQLPLKIFLVAARVDRGGVGISETRIQETVKRLNLDGYFITSAKEDRGILELRRAIDDAIDWNALPRVSSTTLFQRIKNFLSTVREHERALEAGNLLHKVDALYDTFVRQNRQLADAIADLEAQFKTCVKLIEARGLVRRFNFGNLLLLQPELLDAYASAMIIAAKDEADGMGMIDEEIARDGRFHMPETERIPNREQERPLLIATIDDLISHEIALRDEEEEAVSSLVFPSQSTRPYPHIPEPDSSTAIWAFEGPILSIYTKLIVRLLNTRISSSRELYENAAFLHPHDGGLCRLFIQHIEEGRAELMLFMDDVPSETAQYIRDYVQTHLIRRALPNSVQPKQVFVCPNCKTPVSPIVVEKRRKLGKDWVTCGVCEEKVSLRRSTERVRQSLVRQNRIARLDREAESQLKRQRAISRVQGKREMGEWDVFLAYNSEDLDEARRAAEALEQNALLPWVTDRELTDRKVTAESLQDQIDLIGVVAYLAGQDRTSDKWQKMALEYALSNDCRVIPVFLPSAPRRVKTPPSLNDHDWIDFRKPDTEPMKELIRRIIDEKGPRELE